MESGSSSCSEQYRNWLELPRDVTASILQRLGAIEILTSAQHVCKLWYNLCKDPFMWRTIKMYNLDYLGDLEKMCRNAVDRSSGQLRDINIEYFVTDDLLNYIANRFFFFFARNEASDFIMYMNANALVPIYVFNFYYYLVLV